MEHEARRLRRRKRRGEEEGKGGKKWSRAESRMKNFPPPPPPPRRRYKRKAGFLFSKYLRVKEKKYGEKKGKGVGTISGEGKKLVEVLF